MAPEHPSQSAKRRKLHGRAFYESIGSPKVIVAPMVDQSEFAWRMLSRSFMPEASKRSLLAYSPMFHARLFAETPKYRLSCMSPTKTGVLDPPLPAYSEDYKAHLDGNPAIDRPLIVQFCANDPDKLLEAAKLVQPYCDAVDLNLGCPQGIAKKGHYGAFLQEDQDLIYRLINNLHENLDVPVTAKMRILDSREKTLEYARKILSAGASILTVHGRQRHQKGHNTGVADWAVIRYLREQLPPETVLFANGNILQHHDIEACLEATGVDGIMSAEGNLHDPAILAAPPAVGEEGREYWRGKDGKGGWRMDAVLRRYMDIIYKYVLEQPVPERKPLFIASDGVESVTEADITFAPVAEADEEGPPKKKRKKSEKKTQTQDPNLTAMQAHLFQILRPLVSKHTQIRDALARSRAGDMAAFERVLSMVEAVTKQGILEYEQATANGVSTETSTTAEGAPASEDTAKDFRISSREAVERCRRPWWICQPYIRPLPDEAFAKGAMQMSKKEKKRAAGEGQSHESNGLGEKETDGEVKLVKSDESSASVAVPSQPIVCG